MAKSLWILKINVYQSLDTRYLSLPQSMVLKTWSHLELRSLEGDRILRALT